ncbi:Rieske (2Fe-2S) protein [Natronorubrum thiooxidans]|uniref:Ferredoxin subunit of nitrite reductase or a ring-hydroxylating dioxygenase n=1 Tax=Natronorubrum thiooxidans TaxID=308853 RepID=A0A1N7G1D7_9EURY|nr:Rieske 2Fe-2S domain-containing protein [Natronorubrum thiooxidans]SIS06371.1 Ferredoxin subunit of nitrite reductase or a ring-hydroxylating dioxygenase [Natronorubrum thiooxidans]
MNASQRITDREAVSTESTVLFRVTTESGDEREAILVASESNDGETEIACWLNYCQHLTHIKIDKGSGAPMRDGELVCANHGAYFDADSGVCTYGPCEGAYLTALEVGVEDGDVYLTDDEYAFVGVGPIDDDDDMTSTSNVKL